MIMKGLEPVLLKAGDRRLGLGYALSPPKVDCRVLAEETYQEMLKEIAHLKERHQEVCRHKINLRKMNEKLTQRLIDAGLEKPAIVIDQSRNA